MVPSATGPKAGPARPGRHRGIPVQKLHLVGFTTELDGLILATRKGAKSGGYVIALDDKVLATIEEAHRLRNGGAPEAAAPAQEQDRRNLPAVIAKPPKPSSGLSPREIQARLRAGASVAEIAAVAGVDEEWILRFATPIRAEQARVVDRALRLPFTKARLGLSAEPLGESVKANLSDKGLRLHDDVFDEGWSAYNLHGTTWAVKFTFVNRGRTRAAVWQVDLRTGEVTARGRLAGELGYVEPGRKAPRPEPLEPDPVPSPSARNRPGRSAAPKSAAPKSAAPKSAAPKGSPARGSVRRAPAAGEPAAAASTPAPAAPGPGSGVDAERPTHLARPPSPMSSTNRAPNQPGRLAGAPSLRPQPRAVRRPAAAPPEADTAAPAPAQPPSPVEARPQGEVFALGPPPAKPPRDQRAGRSAPVRPVPTIPPMAAPPVIEVNQGDPEPAVVVLSTTSKRRPRQAGRRTGDR